MSTLRCSRLTPEIRALIAVQAVNTDTPLGLTPEADIFLHGMLFRLVCSAPWRLSLHDGIVAKLLPYRKNRPALERALNRVEAYPPGGVKTRMRLCRGCGRMCPPNNVGTADLCADCWYCQCQAAIDGVLPEGPHLNATCHRSLLSGIHGYRLVRVNRRRATKVYRFRTPDGELFDRRRYVAEDGSVIEETETELGFLDVALIERDESENVEAEAEQDVTENQPVAAGMTR